MGRDLNKPGRPLVPEMGGIAVILGFYAGISLLTISAVGVASSAVYNAALVGSLGAGVVGLMDDMFGLKKRTKAILPFLLAVPLGAAITGLGETNLLGVDIGIMMIPVVAVGLTSAANAANMLEGFNGLGAGLMLIISIALIILSFIHQSSEGLFLLFPLAGALAAFLWYNRFPARVFPGDSMTLFAGAAIAAAAIVSSPSLKTYGAILFTPMVIEFVLKARGRFKGENYGAPDHNGLLSYAGPTESLAHLVMKRRPRSEPELVRILWAAEVTVAVAVVSISWLQLLAS